MTGPTGYSGAPSAARLTDCLAGGHGRDGLIALVDGADTWVAVAGAAGVPTDGRPVAAHRVAWKPGRRLRAFYDVPTPSGRMPVAVRWEAERVPGDRPATRLVEAWPNDTSWPHLAEIAGGDAPAEALQAAGWGGSGPVSLEVVRYRPGQRHVLRVRADRTEVYLKIGPAGTASASAAAASVLARAARCAGAVAAEPVWCSDRLGTVAVVAVDGVVADLGASSGVSGTDHVGRMGRFLRALHDGDMTNGMARAADPAAEAMATARAWEHALALHPALGPPLQAALDAAVAGASSSPVRPVLLHGDAKVEHLLDTGDGVAVIDLDSVVAGDPRRDLGRLLASVWWAEAAAGTSGIRGRLFAAYDPEGTVERRAAGGWTALALLKQAARRVPVLDPVLVDRLGGWLETAVGAVSTPTG